MTTIITRLYADKKAAGAVTKALHDAGFPKGTVDVIEAGSGAAAALMAARAGAETAAAVAGKLDGGKAAVVARAPVTPFGAARAAMQIMDDADPIGVTGAAASEYIRETPRGDILLSILSDHPRWFTPDMGPGKGRARGTVSSAFGLRTLSRERERRPAIRGGAFISTKVLPFPLLKAKSGSSSAMSGGGTPFSTLLGWPTVSRRD
jgi:hypothetical protein